MLMNEANLAAERPWSKRFRFLWALLSICGLLIVAAVFMPVLDGPHSRQHANEAAAVSKLRAVATLQSKFASTHAAKGFACELPLLRTAENQGDGVDDDYGPLRFLTTATGAGYKFVIGNCYADAKGVVAHYQVTAVPIEQGTTGFRAFCTDDSGLLWYDPEGSPTNCLASRRALE